jgi:hypothetical protein
VLGFIYCDAEACNAECHYAECHYAKCHYAKCHYAECHYAKCHYAECHAAQGKAWTFLKVKDHWRQSLKMGEESLRNFLLLFYTLFYT